MSWKLCFVKKGMFQITAKIPVCFCNKSSPMSHIPLREKKPSKSSQNKIAYYLLTYLHTWLFIPRKDIYQRIFISHILSKNREKRYSPILFWVGYVEGYNILILGISNFYILYPFFSTNLNFRYLQKNTLYICCRFMFCSQFTFLKESCILDIFKIKIDSTNFVFWC
jgi:hypothetical protein